MPDAHATGPTACCPTPLDGRAGARRRRPNCPTLLGSNGSLPEYRRLRGPEAGLVMVRGRTGGGGARIQSGRDDGHPLHRAHDAALSAMPMSRAAMSARPSWRRWSTRCCRIPRRQSRLLTDVVEPLAAAQQVEARCDGAKAAATRVQFFAMRKMRDMSASIALPGFADPVGDAQAASVPCSTRWRGRDACTRPGNAWPRPRRSIRATAAVLLTLIDHETPLWLDPAAVPARDWMAFHCGAIIVDGPERAAFALALSLPDLAALSAGTHESAGELRHADPADRCAGQRPRYRLSGPGLRVPTPACGGRPAAGFRRCLAAEPRAVPARHRPRAVRRHDAGGPAAQRHDRGGLNNGLCRGQGRRAGDRQRACLAGRGASRRSSRRLTSRWSRSTSSSAGRSIG